MIPLPPPPTSCAPVELRLVVWLEPGSGWRARLSGAGIVEREFTSPFELARFVAWPRPQAASGDKPGLR